MAVMFKIPFILKVFFPILFIIEWVRRFLHKHYIILDCGGYHEACADSYKPWLEDVRNFLTDASKKNKERPTVLEFGCGPYPAFDAYPPNVHLYCVDPCPDFDDQFHDLWNKSHLAR